MPRPDKLLTEGEVENPGLKRMRATSGWRTAAGFGLGKNLSLYRDFDDSCSVDSPSVVFHNNLQNVGQRRRCEE